MERLIYNFDKICRKEFTRKVIVSERDYVSILLNYIRHPFGPLVNLSCGHAQTLPGSHEQKYGCDGIIIFRINNGIKVGLFEAKIIKGSWDSYVGPIPRVSRFSRQLEKQNKINSHIAVWEMFINNNITRYSLDPQGATCVKFPIAYANYRQRPKGNMNDLYNLIDQSYSSNGNIPINLEQIVQEILSCSFGVVISSDVDSVPLYNNENSEINVQIPILKGEVTTKDMETIQKFLKESQIFSYTYIDINKYIEQRRDVRLSNLLNEYNVFNIEL